MKLSIILPSLRENNFDKCLKTIVASTFVDYEVIVVGNFDSLFLLGGWWNQTNLNIRFIRDDKCIGPIYAIQKGLEVSSGDYIVTLSDDALVCPYWANHMTALLEKQPKDKIVLGNFRVYDHTGEMAYLGYFGKQFSMFPIMRKSDIEKIGYYSTEYNAYYSDPDLAMRVHEKYGYIVNSKTSFIYHIYNPDSIHLTNKNLYFKKDEDLFKSKWQHLGDWEGCEKLK